MSYATSPPTALAAGLVALQADVALVANTATTVLSVILPAGTYLLSASGLLTPGSADVWYSVEIWDGASNVAGWAGGVLLGANLPAGFALAPAPLVLPAPATIRLTIEASAASAANHVSPGFPNTGVPSTYLSWLRIA